MSINFDYYSNYNLHLPKEFYKSKGICGLLNINSTCYLNCVLQCLNATLKLTDTLLTENSSQLSQTSNSRSKVKHINKLFLQLIINIWDSNHIIKPNSFYTEWSKLHTIHGQQDAHECLLLLLEDLHEANSYSVTINPKASNNLNSIYNIYIKSLKEFYEKKYSIIIETFTSMFINTIECKHCNNKIINCTPLMSLSLDIEHDNITDCLKDYFETYEIDSWNCDKCNNMGCYKKTSGWHFSNHLIIHFKRFDKTGTKKNNKLVSFGNIDLTPYIHKDKKDKNQYIYTPYAIIFHQGSLHNGHYYCLIQNMDTHWYLCNDAHITKYFSITPKILNTNAYMIFYQRLFIKN